MLTFQQYLGSQTKRVNLAVFRSFRIRRISRLVFRCLSKKCQIVAIDCCQVINFCMVIVTLYFRETFNELSVHNTQRENIDKSWFLELLRFGYLKFPWNMQHSFSELTTVNIYLNCCCKYNLNLKQFCCIQKKILRNFDLVVPIPSSCNT